MTTAAGLENFMNGLLINETFHFYNCGDECVLAVSSEINNQRYACRVMVSSDDAFHSEKKEEIRKDLRLQLFESTENVVHEYRKAKRSPHIRPQTITRWVGVKSDIRILDGVDDASRALASRMVNDLSQLPFVKKQTPVDKINWRKEGF